MAFLLRTEGECDKLGNFKYDNDEMRDMGYQYVDIRYDTYQYVRKTPKAAAVKVKSGHKICRYAQFPEGKGILPSILEELLAERKATRKLIPKQTDEFMRNVLDKASTGYQGDCKLVVWADWCKNKHIL